MRVGAILGLLLTGIIADSYTISAAWITAALIGLINIPVFFINRRDQKDVKSP